MKIVITGYKGQLGQQIFIKGKEEGHQIYHFDHSNLAIENIKKVRKIISHIKPEFIINCAAYNQVDDAEKCWKQS